MATPAPRTASFGRMLWKDAALILPLLLALAGVSILLHVLVGFIPGGHAAFPALALFIPNLFALGGPAMLVGQEEEAGTLRWLRTLPVGWRSTVTAKLLVALAGLLLLWAYSAAVLAVALSLAGGELPSELRTRWVDAGILYALAFSIQLLCCGFAIAWWLRMPVPSLLTLVPAIFATTFGTNAVAGYLVRGRWDDLGRDPRSREMLYGAFGLLLLSVMLTGIAYWMGRRALARPAAARWPLRGGASRSAASSAAYQPPRAESMRRPEPRWALLWQQSRQSAAITIPVFAVGLAGTVAAGTLRDGNWGVGWGPLGVFTAVVCAAVLGSAAFLTDNIDGRHRFLAERGIGTWRVWWTRQLIPATLALIIALALMAALGPWIAGPNHATDGWWLFGAMAICAYCAGQIASQAIARPAVAVMSGPLLLLAAYAVAAVTWSFYPEFTWTAILALPVLWLVTLRLCRRWLDGRREIGYQTRLVAWLGLAVLLLTGPIVLVRWATMPAAMPEWRAATHAEAAAALAGAPPSNAPWPVSLREPQVFRPDLDAPLSRPFSDRQRADLRQLTDHVLNERAFLAPGYPGSDVDVLARLAEWLRHQAALRAAAPGDALAAEMRTLYQRLLRSMLISISRNHNVRTLYHSAHADRLEQSVANELALAESQEVLGRELWSELVALLPTSEQRQQQRRLALLAAWEGYHHDADSTPSFDLYHFHQPRQRLWLEEVRTGRLIDRATRTTLDQLRSGLPAADSPAYRTRIDQWAAVLQGEPQLHTSQLPTAFWHPEAERRIARLRDQAQRSP